MRWPFRLQQFDLIASRHRGSKADRTLCNLRGELCRISRQKQQQQLQQEHQVYVVYTNKMLGRVHTCSGSRSGPMPVPFHSFVLRSHLQKLTGPVSGAVL